MNQLRLILKGIETSTADAGGWRVIVTLSNKGELYTGEAIADDREDQQLAAVAEATLSAISNVLENPMELRLVYSKQIFLAEVGRVIFFVIVQVGGNTPEARYLPGISIFSTLSLEVAAKATLNALNRLLAKFI
ncbi:MAG: hypothetical protein AB1489_08570 [Acidobacteriota bacterium]